MIKIYSLMFQKVEEDVFTDASSFLHYKRFLRFQKENHKFYDK